MYYNYTCASGLSSSGWDLLGQISRWDDFLSEGHAVVLGVDHLQFVADHRVVIDDVADFIEERDDLLRYVVVGGGLTSAHHGPGSEGGRGVPLDPGVEGHHVEDIQQLPLVLGDFLLLNNGIYTLNNSDTSLSNTQVSNRLQGFTWTSVTCKMTGFRII